MRWEWPVRILVMIAMVAIAALLLAGDGSVALRYGPGTSLSKVDASFPGTIDSECIGDDVAILGDIDGDGLDDIAITTGTETVLGSTEGRVWVFLGRSSGWSRGMSLASADACMAEGANDGDWGEKVAGVGDVNGDGLDDFVVGMQVNHQGEKYTGKVYLFLGMREGWRQGMLLEDANASFRGERGYESAGAYVSGAGDVNGDGYDDLLIGAPFNDEAADAAGKCYLILGKASGWKRDVHLSKADASFRGERYDSELGRVAAAGDVDGDGYDDFLLSAPVDKEPDGDMGQAYLFLGKATGWSRNVSVEAADASFHGEGAQGYDSTGLAGGVDVNGDGYDDILIGARKFDNSGVDNGKVYVVFGKASGWTMDVHLSAADATLLSNRSYECAGEVLRAAGDVNGDGLGDFLVSAPWYNPVSDWDGRVYLVLGRRTGWKEDMPLGECAATFMGEGTHSRAGLAAGGGGDVDGDGFDDIVIGSPSYVATVYTVGNAHLVLPDRNVQPATVTTVELFTDEEMTRPAASVPLGDRVFVRLAGTGGNASRPDVTEVVVSSNGSDPGGFRMRLIETGNQTHEFVGDFTIKGRTHEGGRWIGARVGETVTVTSWKDPSRSASVFVTERPVLAPLPSTMRADEDVPFELAPYTMSGLARTWEFSTSMGWLSWDGTDHTASGTPDNRDVGTGWLLVRVDDGYGYGTEANVTVVVWNAPPDILGADATTAAEDAEYQSDYDCTDDGQGVITWHLSTPATWLAINSTTGVLSGTPDNRHVGTHSVEVSVDDGNGGTDAHSFILTVLNVNDPPVIQASEFPSATEDAFFSFNLTAMDVDPGDNLTWTMEGAPAWLHLDARTGELSGTPANDDVGESYLKVTVTDLGTLHDDLELILRVVNVNDPPELLNADVTTATEDVAYRAVYRARDIDAGDAITWTFARNASWLSFDPSTGVLSGRPTNDDVGLYYVNLTVTDASGAMAFHNFTLTVLNVNDPPQIDSGDPPTSATVGKHYIYQVLASDVDLGDSLRYSLDPGPLGMSINETTGLVEWVPVESQVGIHPVAVQVTDGVATARQAFDLSVYPAPVNTRPSITSTAPSAAISIGDAFSYQVVATDPEDQSSLVFSLPEAAPGMSVNATTGLITWTPAAGQAGTHRVTVRVDDRRGGVTDQAFNVTVRPAGGGDEGDGGARFLEGPGLLLLLVIIVIVAVAVCALYIRSRRKGEDGGRT